jgi:hypothetical protein|tara:strand:+ start:9159 stop:9587 length:429 start_codon:yes stop_codon:yes gene_type:complete
MEYYGYDAHNGDTVDPAVTASVLLFFGLFWLVSYAISSFLLGRVFKKAGVPQWAAWVPLYNMWKLLEMGNQHGYWAIFALLPFVGLISIIFVYIAMYHIGKKLGKEDWFVLLAIFLPLVWMIWLGFDDSKWPSRKKEPTPSS